MANPKTYLVLKMPQNKEELLKVNGFGNVKVEKYGEDILKILANGGTK